jgi:DNA invertase Pin-like site-specific DNA recombinase
VTYTPTFAYARTSTIEQHVQTQVARLRAAAAGMGIELPDTCILTDDGVSGRGAERPAFDRLRAEIRSGNVGTVLAVKLDRLGRSTKELLSFFELCEQRGTRVIVTDQSIDTSSPVGRLTRTILGAVAEFELDLIQSRTQEAMDALKSGVRKTRSGRPVGRPRIYDAAFATRVRELRDTPTPDGRRRQWSQIAMMLHRPAGSLRKVYGAFRGTIPRVINPAGDLEHRGAASESSPSTGTD